MTSSVHRVVRWAPVGKGKKLHLFDAAASGASRALCGVGPRGMYIDPWRENQKCKKCLMRSNDL